MGAPDQQQQHVVDSDVLASGVDSLREGLRTFEQSAREMDGIYESFERRLGHLESDMLPMKDISSKLNVARRNITKAVEKMEEVNEYFLLEAEVHATIVGGIRGSSGADQYLEEVRRVVEASRYFRGWPGLRSQQDALKGLAALADAATKECLEEFNRLVRTAGPAGGQADTLSDAAAATLGAIAACLALLGQGPALRQGYSGARGLAVRTAITAWEGRHETAAGAAAAAAAAGAECGWPWLASYLDFAVSAVTGERSLWERALGAGAEDGGGGGGSSGSDAEMEGAFLAVVMPLVDKLVREVDRAVARAQAEVREGGGSDRPGAARHRVGAKSGAGGFLGGMSSIATAKNAALGVEKAAVAALGGDGGGAREADAIVDATVALLEVADAYKRRSGDLADALRVRRAGSGGGENRAVAALRGLEARLDAACLQSCLDLMEGVKADGGPTRRNVPENASVHVLTSSTLRAAKRVMRFRHGYEALASGAKLPWDRGDAAGAAAGAAAGGGKGEESPTADSTDRSPEAQRLPYFASFVSELVRMLLENLVEKSKAYPTGRMDSARRHLFLLNNANYLLLTCQRPVGAPAPARGSTAGLSPMPAGALRNSLRVGGGTGGIGTASGATVSGFFQMTPPRSGASGISGSPAGAMDALSRGSGGGSDPATAALTIAEFLSVQTLAALQRMVSDKVSAYADMLFDPLSRAVRDDVGTLEYQRGGRLLTLECGRLIKAKFTTFNENWEEIHVGQRTVSVSDPVLRERLRSEACGRFVDEYRRLFDKYKDVQFSKKHQGQYLRFPPDAVERGIVELFSG
ncbi:unnamed protein product [Phaeothamnion confervicola]